MKIAFPGLALALVLFACAPLGLRAVDLRADDLFPPVPPGDPLPAPDVDSKVPALSPSSPSSTQIVFPRTNQASPTASTGGVNQTGRGGQSGNAARHFEKLRQELGLTPRQMSKIKPILERAMVQVHQVRQSANLPARQKQMQIRQIHRTAFQQIRPLLTQQQLERWKELHHRRQSNARSS